MLWKHTQKLIEKVETSLLDGGFLVFDPSSGSGSSYPGWAFYARGELIASGILKVPIHWELHLKLGAIREMVQELCERHSPDVAVIEQIESMRGFRGKSVDTLMKSVGAIMSGIPCDLLIEIAPRVWKKSVDADYVKSDEADAVYMGKFVIDTCKRLKQERGERVWAPVRKTPSTRKPKKKKHEIKRKSPSSATSLSTSPRGKRRLTPSEPLKKRGTRRT